MANGMARYIKAIDARRDSKGLALALATALVAAAFAMPLFAEPAVAATTMRVQEPGVMVDEAGARSIFGDALASPDSDQVFERSLTQGDTLVLSGDYAGGWGSVTFTWERSTDAAAWLLGLQGEGLQAASNDDPTWTTISTKTVQGIMPNLNEAVTSGGPSQTITVDEPDSGTYAYRLTASDEAGFSHSTSWVVQVEESQSVADETNGHKASSTVSVISVDGDDVGMDRDEWLSGDLSNGGNQTLASNARVSMNQKQNGKDAESPAIGMPQTGDVLTGLLIALPVAALGALCMMALNSLTRRYRKRDE